MRWLESASIPMCCAVESDSRLRDSQEPDSVYAVSFPKAFDVCGASPQQSMSRLRLRVVCPHLTPGAGGLAPQSGHSGLITRGPRAPLAPPLSVGTARRRDLCLDSSFGWVCCIHTQRTLLTWHAVCPPSISIAGPNAKSPPLLVRSCSRRRPSHTISLTNHPFITTLLVVDAWLTARRSRRESHSLPPGDAPSYNRGRTHTACMPRPCGPASESWDPLR